MKNIEFYGGCGRCYYAKSQKGAFKVKCDEKIEKTLFANFGDALMVYDSIKTEKSLWDMTSVPELVECHIFAEETEL